jgi:U4/U6 small nuclear ribonucleoprotein PRP31
LDDCKTSILNYLKSLMPLFAPNLSALVGPFLAAQLVSCAGGIASLATMPSQNIESVGSHKRSSGGLSASSVATRVSLISSCDLVSSCPVETRKRAVRLVLGKAAICARVDQFGGASTYDNDSSSLGQVGEKLRQEIIEALRKTNEPPPARAVKPLPIPQDLLPKKTRRGGARARRFKEKYALTETQKQANRVQFGSDASQYQIDGDIDVVDRGMIGVEIGQGRIGQSKKKQKISSSANERGHGENGSIMSIATIAGSGSTSSLVTKNDLFSNNISFNK